MSNIVQFPDKVRISDFMASEALKEQVRMALGAACGAYHGTPTEDDRRFALSKIEEALILIRAERALSQL